jgi:uncharacterized membrane protein YebE (DUF533 family)
MRGTWQTTDGGGGGLLELVAAIVVIAVVVSAAGPVVAAVGELVHILLIAVAVTGGLAAVGLVAFTAYRVRRRRSLPTAARVLQPPGQARAAQPLPAPQRPAIEPAPAVHIHHHWHGVDAEDVAAVLRRQQD